MGSDLRTASAAFISAHSESSDDLDSACAAEPGRRGVSEYQPSTHGRVRYVSLIIPIGPNGNVRLERAWNYLLTRPAPSVFLVGAAAPYTAIRSDCRSAASEASKSSRTISARPKQRHRAPHSVTTRSNQATLPRSVFSAMCCAGRERNIDVVREPRLTAPVRTVLVARGAMVRRVLFAKVLVFGGGLIVVITSVVCARFCCSCSGRHRRRGCGDGALAQLPGVASAGPSRRWFGAAFAATDDASRTIRGAHFSRQRGQ